MVGLDEAVLRDPVRLEAVDRARHALPAHVTRLDDVAALAARLVNAPMATVTLVGDQEEYLLGACGLPENLTAAQYLSLQAAGAEPVDCAGLLETIRAVKDDDEVAALREAADLAEELVRRLPGWLRPGRTEHEIAGEIEYAQRHLGAERSAAPILVSSGHRSVLPHGAASSSRAGAHSKRSRQSIPSHSTRRER